LNLCERWLQSELTTPTLEANQSLFNLCITNPEGGQMVRTIREAVQGGILILLPRLHDTRVSKKEQDDFMAAVTVAVHVLLEIPPDNIVPVPSRVPMVAALNAQIAIVSAVDEGNPGVFQPWELYNASDLWTDAAGAITAGEPTFESTLNPF
jgi:hypothetical protein